MTVCHYCFGVGEVEETRDARPTEANGGMSEESRYVLCPHCEGTGLEHDLPGSALVGGTEGDPIGSSAAGVTGTIDVQREPHQTRTPPR